ncbi:DUF2474 domain-containing protein [Paracoccus limosus]|nr:DUF2474 domain-containing protein [Paracoccus limosus]
MRLVRMEMTSRAPGSLGSRLGWMALIWALSVIGLGVVALGFRLVMQLAGLTA